MWARACGRQQLGLAYLASLGAGLPAGGAARTLLLPCASLVDTRASGEPRSSATAQETLTRAQLFSGGLWGGEKGRDLGIPLAINVALVVSFSAAWRHEWSSPAHFADEGTEVLRTHLFNDLQQSRVGALWTREGGLPWSRTRVVDGASHSLVPSPTLSSACICPPALWAAPLEIPGSAFGTHPQLPSTLPPCACRICTGAPRPIPAAPWGPQEPGPGGLGSPRPFPPAMLSAPCPVPQVPPAPRGRSRAGS